MPLLPPHCFLLGMRASGKSTAGKALADRLGWAFADTDALVCRQSGKSIAEIVETEGWPAFRALESKALRAATEDFTVIATGGGIILDSENRSFLRGAGLCIYLEAPADLLAARLRHDPQSAQRPPLTQAWDGYLAETHAVLKEREALYRQTAHVCVDASAALDDLVRDLEHLVTASCGCRAPYPPF